MDARLEQGEYENVTPVSCRPQVVSSGTGIRRHPLFFLDRCFGRKKHADEAHGAVEMTANGKGEPPSHASASKAGSTTVAFGGLPWALPSALPWAFARCPGRCPGRGSCHVQLRGAAARGVGRTLQVVCRALRKVTCCA